MPDQVGETLLPNPKGSEVMQELRRSSDPVVESDLLALGAELWGLVPSDPTDRRDDVFAAIYKVDTKLYTAQRFLELTQSSVRRTRSGIKRSSFEGVVTRRQETGLLSEYVLRRTVITPSSTNDDEHKFMESVAILPVSRSDVNTELRDFNNSSLWRLQSFYDHERVKTLPLEIRDVQQPNRAQVDLARAVITELAAQLESL